MVGMNRGPASDNHVFSPLFHGNRVLCILLLMVILSMMCLAIPLKFISGNTPFRTRDMVISVDIDSEGVNGRTCFSMYRVYNLTVTVDGIPPGEIKEVNLRVAPYSYDIHLIWNRSVGAKKINSSDSENRLLYFGSKTEQNDSLSLFYLTFFIKFSWNWNEGDLKKIALNITTDGGQYSDTYSDVFKVKNVLFIAGNLELKGEKEESLYSENWVMGNYRINLSGLRVRYEDPLVYIPPSDQYIIDLNSTIGELNVYNPSPDGFIDLSFYTPNETYENLTYRIYLSGAAGPYLRNDYSFKLNVDSDPPFMVKNLQMHPDAVDDPPSKLDNDLVIFLTWDSGGDVGSGVNGYLLGLNGGVPNQTAYSRMRLVLSKAGKTMITVVAVDRVGNIGVPSSINITVDNLPPIAKIIAPKEGVWYNHTYIDCIVYFIDVGGAGLDESSIRYSLTKSPTLKVWKEPKGALFENGTLKHSISNLTDGMENYLRWQISDRVGNILQTDPIRVYVDTKPPTFSNPNPSPMEILHQTEIRFSVELDDNTDGSGINISTIQYRYSTAGPNNFNNWSEVPDLPHSPQIHITFSVALNLTSGFNNFVQFRAKDVANNIWGVSEAYQIKINTPPVVVVLGKEITSGNAPSYKIEAGKTLIINASGTYDIDNDHLTYHWRSDVDGAYPQSSPVLTIEDIKAGNYNITLSVDDGYGNVVSITFFVSVTPKETTPESEGILKEFSKFLEPPYFYIIIFLAIIIVVALTLLSTKKNKESEEVVVEGKSSNEVEIEVKKGEGEEVSFDMEGGGENVELMELDSSTSPFSQTYPFTGAFGSAASQNYSTRMENEDLLDEFDFEYDLYDVLGISEDADTNEIKRAYRSLAAKYHPDKAKVGGVDMDESKEMMIKINKAKEILLNPEKRALYDRYRESSFTVED